MLAKIQVMLIEDDDADDDYEVLWKQPTCFTFPLTITSSRSDEQDKINSLDEGTDNHTARPYKAAELMAGIRSFLQYISVKNPDKLYRAKGLEINFEKRRVQLNGSSVHLTPIEYQIITLLAKDSGKVLTYEVIMRTIWGPYCGDDNEILRVHMTNIRRKLEPQPPRFQYILTVPGIGYRMPENELCYGFTVNEANISHISSSVK